MKDSVIEKQPARVLHELQDAARNYRIITSDEEIFHRTGAQIVSACRLQMTVSAWLQNWDLAVEYVRKWCVDNADRLAIVLVDFRSGKTVFYVAPRSDTFDGDLADRQSELDLWLNTRGAIGYAETRQIPPWDLKKFVSSEALRVWPTDQTAPPEANK
jgi:hypothetical protein